MKELVVISGKGGTGKTSLVASFAALAKDAIVVDCDVDAADLHLVLNPTVRGTNDFVGGKRAVVMPDRCVSCGRCMQLCQFGAVSFDGPANDVISKTYAIDPISCEGCGVCVEFCPAKAIRFEDCVNGQWFVSDTRFGPMVHAKLGIAEENSGKLVTLLRKQARQMAEQQHKQLVLVDGSPGTGCPVIASITGADMVLVVTEPTQSGLHDLERVAELIGKFKIPTLVCINKVDINLDLANEIEQNSDKLKAKVIGKIHYDDAFTDAQIAGTTVVEYSQSSVKDEIMELWNIISDKLEI